MPFLPPPPDPGIEIVLATKGMSKGLSQTDDAQLVVRGELAFGSFFLGGLALTFTPCVLPMLPILTGVVLRGQPGGARSLVLSLAYVCVWLALNRSITLKNRQRARRVNIKLLRNIIDELLNKLGIQDSGCRGERTRFSLNPGS